ncbi:hypothetical protein [Arthrobacter sp. 754]|uniref:hypothetical protein n=1 Tax=Arthrobacter sp. 754 TaxID=3156315 RepID=UPI0033997502
MAEVTPSGSGGPIRLSGPAADGELEIRGGIGGITFQLEELIRGAGKLDDLAGELAAVEVEVHRIREDLGIYQNDSRTSGTMALLSVGEAEWSVRAVRDELQRISSQVRASKRDYETAEEFAAYFADRGIPTLKDFEHVRMDVLPIPDLRGTELFLRSIPGVRRSILEASGHLVPALRPRPVTADRKESVPIEFDGSPAALLERARIVDERGDGYIEVIEVDDGGKKAYVVVIPGTQTGGEMGGSNPFDEAGISEGLNHRSKEINAAVVQALRAAGAETGAPVVAVGYSQGGIHAMNLAADELILKEFEVKYVLTAGSPVGGIAPAAGISTLHLEHRQDWVPGTDGTPGPDARNRVTVTLNGPAHTPEGEDLGLGPGHNLGNYENGARLISASADPSLVASTAVLGGVLGAGGKATATRFALTRSRTETADAPGPRLQGPSQRPEADRQVSTGKMQG